MADLVVTQRESLGDGRVSVTARTPAGEYVNVVMGYNHVDTDMMWAMLRSAAAQSDRISSALETRAGRSDQEE